jgi:hypothetical protein
VNDQEENTTVTEMITKETRLTEVVTIELRVMTDVVMPVTTDGVMIEIKKWNVVAAMATITGIKVVTTTKEIRAGEEITTTNTIIRFK